MLHLVQSLDGNTTRCGHEVNSGLRVHATGLQQLYGTFHRLHHDLLGIVGFEAQFHTTFTGSTDITHGVGNATAGEGRSCCQMLFVGDQRMAHLVENVDHGLSVFL